MWEIISANQRKTFLFFVVWAFLFMLFGYIFALLPALYLNLYINWSIPRVCFFGSLFFLYLFLLSILSTYFYGNSILLKRCRAKELKPEMSPMLFNILDEIAIAAGISYRPGLYVTPGLAPNSFATGIRKEDSIIVLSTGLLTNLNRDQLQGVIAHELSHIINRDTLYLSFAGSILNTIPDFSSVDSLNRNTKGFNTFVSIGDKLNDIFKWLCNLLYFNLAKNREYIADAMAVRFTRYPGGLASALERISANKSMIFEARNVVETMCIVNPYDKKTAKTHPPTELRIKILRNISKGVNYKYYQDSYNAFNKQNESIIPDSMLQVDGEISIRDNIESTEKKLEIEDLSGIISELVGVRKNKDGYKYILCNCGLKLKIPSGFKSEEFRCPRCSARHYLADAVDRNPDSPYRMSPFDDGTREIYDLADNGIYKRRHQNKWESFYCQCGYIIQLSPDFRRDVITCYQCGKEIEVLKEEKSNAEKVRNYLDNKLENKEEKSSEEKPDYIMEYRKVSDNWQYFSCKCGNIIELPAEFNRKYTRCQKCRGKIKIL